MKIAQIVPIWFPVPPKKFGGLELVVSNLTSSLINKGHEVVVYGYSDMYPANKPLLKDAPHTVDWLKNKNFELDNFIQAICDSEKFDILHFHVSTDLFPLMIAQFSKKPTLITIHNYDAKKPDDCFYKKYKNNLVFPNNLLSELDKNQVFSVYHGINNSIYKYSEDKENYLVYLSRVEKDKGILDAVKVAKKLKIKLFIMGPIPPISENFFVEEIKPLLNENIVYLGEADLSMKNKYLSKAKALIFPTKYPETFGLVAIEAMACGTPVIAYDSGAVSEIVENNKTGFVVKKDDVNALIDAVDRVFNMDEKESIKMSKNCSDRVAEKFSIDKMTIEYLKIYTQLTKGKNA